MYLPVAYHVKNVDLPIYHELLAFAVLLLLSIPLLYLPHFRFFVLMNREVQVATYCWTKRANKVTCKIKYFCLLQETGVIDLKKSE